jgi:SAM-dependent methyltransferase
MRAKTVSLKCRNTESRPLRWYTTLFPRTYFPSHFQNRMESEGDLQQARDRFLLAKNNNLRKLLHNRYVWMNEYIKRDDVVVDIGAGAGFSQEFIKTEVTVTEIIPYHWVDICVDAANLPFGAETLDVVICSNVLHHFATPIRFLEKVYECLKPGGHVLIFEPNPSFLLLLALRMMRHEGWSFEVDVFDPTALANDPKDPWSGNNAISYLMFRDPNVFEENSPGFEVIHHSFAECMMFPLSGGVTAKTKIINLSITMLRIIDWLDGKLCRLSPYIFAMARLVVLRKRASGEADGPYLTDQT